MKRARLALETPVAAFGFDESSGTSIGDASGQGHNTTLSGQTRVAGKYGGALEFSENFVSVADSNLLDLTTGMTLSAWVLPGELEPWATVIYKETEENAVYGLDASSPAGSPIAFVSSPTTSHEVDNDDFELPTGVWSHLAATYDASALRLWINGDQVASAAFSQSIAATSGALRIGGNSLFGEFFNGTIDEVRIYNRALSEDEIERDIHTPINPSGPDITPPTISITDPANGGRVAGTVPITAAAADNVSVAG